MTYNKMPTEMEYCPAVQFVHSGEAITAAKRPYSQAMQYRVATW